MDDEDDASHRKLLKFPKAYSFEFYTMGSTDPRIIVSDNVMNVFDCLILFYKSERNASTITDGIVRVGDASNGRVYSSKKFINEIIEPIINNHNFGIDNYFPESENGLTFPDSFKKRYPDGINQNISAEINIPKLEVKKPAWMHAKEYNEAYQIYMNGKQNK